MESVQHIKTQQYFDISDNEFEIFQNFFGRNSIEDEDYAVGFIETHENELGLSRKYTEDEIKSIFWLHAELTGLDKEIEKNNISKLSNRIKAKTELKQYIQNKKTISIKTAKELLKVLDAFDNNI